MPRTCLTRSFPSRTFPARTFPTRSFGTPNLTPLNPSTVATRIAGLKSTAYYNPNNWTWYQFENFNSAQLNTDLTTIAADGFTNVRIVIPVQDGNTLAPIFGVPTPSSTQIANLAT